MWTRVAQIEPEEEVSVYNRPMQKHESGARQRQMCPWCGGCGRHFMPSDGLLESTGCQHLMAMAAMRMGMRSVIILDEAAVLQYAYWAGWE